MIRQPGTGMSIQHVIAIHGFYVTINQRWLAVLQMSLCKKLQIIFSFKYIGRVIFMLYHPYIVKIIHKINQYDARASLKPDAQK
ncbi:MAG: hypothetical protein ACEY3J_00335 [Arsenophonus sp.]